MICFQYQLARKCKSIHLISAAWRWINKMQLHFVLEVIQNGFEDAGNWWWWKKKESLCVLHLKVTITCGTIVLYIFPLWAWKLKWFELEFTGEHQYLIRQKNLQIHTQTRTNTTKSGKTKKLERNEHKLHAIECGIIILRNSWLPRIAYLLYSPMMVFLYGNFNKNTWVTWKSSVQRKSVYSFWAFVR